MNKFLPLAEEIESWPTPEQIMHGPQTEAQTAADEFNYSFFLHFINGCNKAADDELRRHLREINILPPLYERTPHEHANT